MAQPKMAREVIAQRIIEVATGGERDSVWLGKAALTWEQAGDAVRSAARERGHHIGVGRALSAAHGKEHPRRISSSAHRLNPPATAAHSARLGDGASFNAVPASSGTMELN
jgi:hypothetical protein